MDQHRITVLDNGLTVATEHVPGARSVAIGAWVGIGARDEPGELGGVGHFLEHALFKGTATRSARDIASLVEAVGGDVNAFTAKEYTAFYCRLPASHLALGFEVLGDLLVRAELRDDDVESERHVILEELAMDDDSPEDVVHRVLAELVFASHPLGRDTAGSIETVSAITPDALRAWFAERYRPDVMVLSVAGKIDHDHAVEAAQGAFGHMESGSGRPRRAAPAVMGPAEVAVDDDTEQVHLALGMRAPAREHPDRAALDVLAHVVGGGPASRLFDSIREQRGLAYSVYCATSAYDDTGALTVYAGTGREHLDELRLLVDEELAAVAARGIEPAELAVASGYLCGSYELGLEDPGARMSRLGAQLVTTGRVRPVDEQLARWAAVSLADVARLAAELLGGHRVTAVVGPAAT